MRLGVLFSGGKDSVYALWKAMDHHEIVCLITILSRNPESYMFHTPNVEITSLQAQALGIPHITVTTEGEKEVELADLEQAIRDAIGQHGIQGIVTGAIESVYQATRVQRICNDLGLWCFNPLWKKDQVELLRELVEFEFDVIISGIFAFPLTERWLGRRLDSSMVDELIGLEERYRMNPSGEGGEIETTVLDAPFFNKRIVILDSHTTAKGNAGNLIIQNAQLHEKRKEVFKGDEDGGEDADRDEVGRTGVPTRNTMDVIGELEEGPNAQMVDPSNSVIVVDMNSTPDSLSYPEFVAPILRILKEGGYPHVVVNLRDLTVSLVNWSRAVIFTGNPLMDSGHIENLDRYIWIKGTSTPLLGICAGMQFIAGIYGSPLIPCSEIGMVQVHPAGDDPLIRSSFEAYDLHNYSIDPSSSLEVIARSEGCVQAFRHKEKMIYGVLFHPEVRNPDIMREFLKIIS